MLEESGYWLGSIAETEGFKLDRRFELVGMLDQDARRVRQGAHLELATRGAEAADA